MVNVDNNLLEKIYRQAGTIKVKQEAGYRKLLADNNFDPGEDMIILPETLCEKIGLTKENIPTTLRKQVVISSLVKEITLMRRFLLV